MDYMKFVDYHRSESADITVACIPNSKERAKDFGLMKIDSKKRIVVCGGVMGEGQRRGGQDLGEGKGEGDQTNMMMVDFSHSVLSWSLCASFCRTSLRSPRPRRR